MRRFLILLVLTVALMAAGYTRCRRPPELAQQAEPAAGETVVQAEVPVASAACRSAWPSAR